MIHFSRLLHHGYYSLSITILDVQQTEAGSGQSCASLNGQCPMAGMTLSCVRMNAYCPLGLHQYRIRAHIAFDSNKL